MEQRSSEWFEIRCGKVTASRIADMTARIKSGWGASRANYLAELVVERMTGTPAQGGYVNAAMLRGVETEPEACVAYEFFSDNIAEPVGFVQHPTITQSGASPDGLIGKDGCLEVKCPNTATHIETLLGRAVPQKYFLQIQWQLACSGRKWGDFVSYDPRMPEELKLFVRRVPRDDKKIAELESQVIVFLEEVDSKVAQLMALSKNTSYLAQALESSIRMMGTAHA